MPLPIPSTVKADLFRARANLLQAARTLRDNGHAGLADKASAIVADLNAVYAPPPAPSTTQAEPPQRKPQPAPRRPPAQRRDATTTTPPPTE